LVRTKNNSENCYILALITNSLPMLYKQVGDSLRYTQDVSGTQNVGFSGAQRGECLQIFDGILPVT